MNSYCKLKENGKSQINQALSLTNSNLSKPFEEKLYSLFKFKLKVDQSELQIRSNRSKLARKSLLRLLK